LNASAAVIRRIPITIAALCVATGLAFGWSHANAQPILRPQVPQNPQPVGASEIFDALTQADAPSDLQRLRALRDSLAGSPDSKSLNDMRVQVDTLLRDAEHRQGEMPPALVMSGIASRIDTAITRLETAHPAPVAPAIPGPPWLFPALAALCGTLAICLVACLAALAAQARSTEESDELRETLGRIRRKLEDVAAGARKTKDSAGELSDEAAESLQEVSVSITRLQSSAKDAESLLRTSTEAAEQRMQGAVAVASQLETWLEQLPSRLNGAIARVEGLDPADLEAVSRIGEHAILFPDFLSALQDACNEMRATTEALAEANAAATPTDAVGPDHMGELRELGDSAALATEMTNLAYGHALRLEDVIGQLMRTAEVLPDLRQMLEQALAHMPLQIEHHTALAQGVEAATARADTALAKLNQFVENVLPEILAAMADAVTRKGIAALTAASEHCESAAKAAAEMPVTLQDAVSALSQTQTIQQSNLAEAILRLSALAETLPEAGASLVASSEALKRHVARDTKREAVSRAAIAEISAAAQAARADLAAAADAVAAMPAQNERLSSLLSQGEQLLAGLETKAAEEADSLQRARNEALAGVEMAIGKMQVAAERLHAGADAQEHALARVRRAALTVATLAGAEGTAEDEVRTG
jgi:chromosome segregation ATPase